MRDRNMIYGLYDPLDNLLYVGFTKQDPKKALSSLWSKRSSRAGALGEWLRSLDEKPRLEVLEETDNAERVQYWIDHIGADRLTNDKDSFADVDVDKPREDQDVEMEVVAGPTSGESHYVEPTGDEVVISYTDEVAEFLATGKLRDPGDTDQTRSKKRPTFSVAVVNNSMGDVDAHLAGCADVKKRSAFDGSVHYGSYEHQVQVAADYYEDQIEESDLVAADFAGDINFKPCLKDLPYDHLEDTETAPEAPAEETVTEAPKKPRKPSKLRGRKLSPEHRAKISAKLKGKPLSDEHKAKISNGQKGKKLTPEHRQKLSEVWVRRRAKKAAELAKKEKQGA